MRIGWNSSVNLIHKWHKSMDEMQRVIRIVFIDFRKAFDLIDHNKLLQNIKEIFVRSVLIRWFASYLNERSHILVKNEVVVDKNTILFMHDTTSWKALDVHNHGNISKKIDLVKDFAESEKMELNPEKW